MYIQIGGTNYTARKPTQSKPFGTWWKINIPDIGKITLPVSGVLKVCSDEDEELVTVDTTAYERQEKQGYWLVLTNESEPVVPEIDPVVELATAKAVKTTEMNQQCNATIVSGISIGDDNYSLKTEDQLNMMSLLGTVQNGAESVPYHADGKECRFYTAEEFIVIATAATNWKLYHESYYNSLRNYIGSLESIESVQGIYYGIEIPDEYKSDVLKDLEGNEKA